LIPSNILLTQLLPLNELTVQPTAQASAISDKLSELIPGQRVLAEIQARLPNGSYRAAVGQHDVTLSLNFSAKPGDTLELEVVENNGRLALVTPSKGPATKPPLQESVATSLSRTGQLISSLTTRSDGKSIAPAAILINNGAPISSSATLEAATLAPMLQSSIEKSGLFYEAHLARWTFGSDFTEQQLRQEPQGQLSTATPPAKSTAAVALENTQFPDSKTLLQQETSTQSNPAKTAEITGTTTSSIATQLQPANTQATTATIPPELTPLVQQQLASLNNQPLQWQGQLIPGQNFYWEIVKDEEEHGTCQNESTPSSWQTRLRLSLPELGDIEARLYIKGIEIRLVLEASDVAAREKLAASKGALRNNLATSGLTLTSIGISPPALIEASQQE
jgi:hypothetical protein